MVAVARAALQCGKALPYRWLKHSVSGHAADAGYMTVRSRRRSRKGNLSFIAKAQPYRAGQRPSRGQKYRECKFLQAARRKPPVGETGQCG